jgi:hypothetical protein
VVGCGCVSDHLLQGDIAAAHIHPIELVPPDCFYPQRKSDMRKSNAPHHSFQNADPSLFPGVEIANQNNRAGVVSQLSFELQHLVKKWPAQAKIYPVAIEH